MMPYMETVFTFNDITKCSEIPVVLTIGMYDGVHLGHQKVLSEAKKIALTKGAILLAITFSNHPTEILHPGIVREPIYPVDLKCEYLAQSGVDLVLLTPFTEDFAKQTAEEFLTFVDEHQSFSDIVLGYDATFGSDQENNRQHVLQAANKFHADVHYISALSIDEQPVSSRRIRELLKENDILAAEKLLGRRFSVSQT
ncbi:MAG: FAD synthetase family protein [Chlamydiota bacterium]